ncbi:SDR family oxidoreductase [Almyronema epifaneia]|uniref:SDR family oxidoreductase n=1 Tax=Almyronema epifaneia S1 TaxID=2991925 RepID=A0ABW6ICD4_9CYAN
MKTLQGKVAIVTGSSRGIGRAIAERLGRDGATVVVTYHSNQDEADQVVETIKSSGSEAMALQVNVKDMDSIKAMFQAALKQYAKVDILVNNAAGKNIFKPTALMTLAEYDSMFDITRGVYFTLQAAIQHLADGGRIVSTSTSGTVMAIPAGGAYAGCKAAIEQFSACLAKELGERGITVNTVSPGVTDTDGLVLDEEATNQLIAQTPLGRLGQPADIADVVAMLVSSDGRWITGQHIRANGGIV